jgi:protein-disulfide isomerase
MMSKRQEMRKRNRREKKRNRLQVILLVIAGAVLFFFFILLLNSKSADTKAIIQITPVHYSVPVNKTSVGNLDAPVKLDVWEDFQCSGCMTYTKDLEPQVLQTYVETGKVYYTFHFYPFIDGGQGESQDAANAALCATAQERFWDYHATLFANFIGENAGSFTKPRLVAFAQNIGLEMTAFNKCFQENTYSAQIKKDMEAGAKLGVPPTPGIFVNGKMVIGSGGRNYLPLLKDVFQAIDTALGGN